MKGADRDAWTTYAEQHGTLRHDPVTLTRSKYGNVKIQVDGHVFDSKREAARFQELKYMQQAKQIDELELQPAFPLHVMELFRSQAPIVITTVGMFKADFRYRVLQGPATGEIVVEDVKAEPTKTEAYRLRKTITEAVHGVTITEVY